MRWVPELEVGQCDELCVLVCELVFSHILFCVTCYPISAVTSSVCMESHRLILFNLWYLEE